MVVTKIILQMFNILRYFFRQSQLDMQNKFDNMMQLFLSTILLVCLPLISKSFVQKSKFFIKSTIILPGTGCALLLSSPSSQVIEEESEGELISRINAEVLAETGVELEQLINPSKVVNLERDIIKLTASLSSASIDEKRRIEDKIDKKRSVLAVEKRAVMRDWLKNLFIGQSVLAGVISFLMVYDIVPGYEGNVALPVKVLGFWMWWLFIIPSLRFW